MLTQTLLGTWIELPLVTITSWTKSTSERWLSISYSPQAVHIWGFRECLLSKFAGRVAPNVRRGAYTWTRFA